ncbi:WD40/YVTN/BNR-like repeat-containing protein [Halocalculus aciditolerans]|uniref:Photosynthesis system II assembly factor Ycf48/Hcf136-like domain-containing protein n=1 Tax=Halocalculus aciditolerans TaxID=1383812 RepID=A0A830FE81_9EURY|nr:hypothetical protein [Halocalculus aciditolerans]GGL46561.1 hypothetical protein GCM10009039_01150 [Halocalculus aciditolerans]
MALSRRAFVKTVGLAGAAGGGVVASTSLQGGETKNGWQTVDSTVEGTLYDTVMSTAGPVAVGGDGVVLLREPGGWRPILEHGPHVAGNGLLAADRTDDRSAVWFVGGGGAVGRYDVRSKTLIDFSAPGGKTSSWADLSVVGSAGDERVFLINGSGEFVAGDFYDGGVDWSDVLQTDAKGVSEEQGIPEDEPGSGSSALGLDFATSNVGFACDTTSGVYRTTNAGQSWQKIGIEDAQVGFQDVAALPNGRVVVAGGGGLLYSYNGSSWRKQQIGDDNIYALETGTRTVASGANGVVYEKGSSGWESTQTSTSSALYGMAYDRTGNYPDIAVGDSGVIVESGDYQGSLPNTIELTGAQDTSTSYRFSVTDVVARGPNTENAKVEEGHVASGVVGGDTDTFGFSGDISTFAVTGGDPDNLTVTVNGAKRSASSLGTATWEAMDVPFDGALYDVVNAGDDSYAGGEGGTFLHRTTDDGDAWEVVETGGPRGSGDAVRKLAASTDGNVVWAAGESGSLGRYTVTASTGDSGSRPKDGFDDHSQPEGHAGGWTALAVAGDAGNERVVVAGQSGGVYTGTYASGNDGVSWHATRITGGVAVTALDMETPQNGYLADENGDIYHTTDGGRNWDRIGIDGGDADITDLAVLGPEEIYASAGDGTVIRYNGRVWTKRFAGASGLNAVDAHDGDLIAAGASGKIYAKGTWQWEPQPTPTQASLHGIAVGHDNAPTLVSGGGGTVLRRHTNK